MNARTLTTPCGAAGPVTFTGLVLPAGFVTDGRPSRWRVRDGQKFIIDGQQPLTSLTLLLIYLHRNLTDEEEKKQLADLIFSPKYGKRSFNLDVPDRTPCMEALYTGKIAIRPTSRNRSSTFSRGSATSRNSFPTKRRERRYLISPTG